MVQRFKFLPFFFFVVVVFTSCQKKYTDHPLILKADTLLTLSSKEAVTVLKSIPNPESLSDADYPAWCLLSSYSSFLFDTPPLSDSIILATLHYYQASGLKRQIGLSYFVLGNSYFKSRNVDLAMEAFKNAESYFIETRDKRMLGVVYFEMARLYMLDNFFDKSILYYKKAQKCFHDVNDLKGEASSYTKIANSMDNLGMNLDSVLYYFKKSQDLSLQSGCMKAYHSACYEMGMTLIYRDVNIDLAKRYILRASPYKSNISLFSKNLSMAYSKLNMPDSAIYYFDKSFAEIASNYDNTMSKHYYIAETYTAGIFAFIAKNDYKSAVNCFFKYDTSRDSVMNEVRRNELYKVEQRYNVSKKELENAKLKIVNRNIVIFVIVLLILILLIVQRLRMAQLNSKQQMLKAELEQEKLMKTIEKKRILLMTKLQLKMENALRFDQLKMKLKIENDHKIPAMHDLLKEFVLTESDWQQYVDEVNVLFADRFEKVTSEISTITLADKIVLALISLNLDITSSCAILNITKNTMYRRRNTIKERLGLDASVDLDEWVRDNIVNDAGVARS